MPAADATGIWLIGARGSVATTTIVGAAAVARGLVPPTALVTQLPLFAAADLPPLGRLVFGGHDPASTPLRERARALARDGVIPHGLEDELADQLESADRNVCAGIVRDDLSRPPLELIRRVQADIEAFRRRAGVARVVVVNVSSTEAPQAPDIAHEKLDALQRAVEEGSPVLSTTGLYAYAALDAGCPFVDFTPSLGGRMPSLFALARARGVPYAGSDGKTGETLIKTALAPAFAARALRVRSWSGTNLLGGGDGATLADPHAAASKLDSKSACLEAILGYEVQGPVTIENVPDLGEWKTAWDHISFEGFLGTRMRMQFIWEGCDSALAAPLVLDLARLVARAHAGGQSGPLAPLAFFFKDPVATDEHRLEAQFALLADWVTGLEAVKGAA
jgi:myo-inositol-1-phosphate synthase